MKDNLGRFVITVFLLLGLVIPAHADEIFPRGIALDGTIGNAGTLNLPGADYEIKSEYGHQAGSNLFHSFTQFNLHFDERATFTGPNTVRNIINRVTGGNASWIDGTLRSEIPHADLYFLNPAGVMFGPNAFLDLDGSFHVSTADYLRLGDNEKFYAMAYENPVLSLAAPTAFGFLDDEVSPITVKGRGEITEQEWNARPTGLHVSEGSTISLVGGNIEIKKGTSYQQQKIDETGEAVTEIVCPGDIKAPGGQINIASVASAGEVEPGNSSFKFQVSRGGDIAISDKSLGDVSGTRGGSIFIRGGQFVVNDSRLDAKTLGDEHGGIIDIQADNISLDNGAVIDGSTKGSGNGSAIHIQASASVSLCGENDDARESAIYAQSGIKDEITGDDLGDAGKISIQAENIFFKDGTLMSSESYGGGKTGNLTLRADESVIFSGNNASGSGSRILARTYGKETAAGHGGSLVIEGENISFADGAYINSNTWGKGKGGDVTLKASETVSFSGEDTNGWGSAVEVAANDRGEGAGDAGNLVIEANAISFTEGAYILSSTDGRGKGGEVTLNASDSVIFAGERNNGWSSGISLETRYTEEGAGDGGSLRIEADDISFTNGGFINSRTTGKGSSGKVTLNASETVTFVGESSIADSSQISMSTQYEGEGAGASGDISIHANTISFKDSASIEAYVYGKGNAGTVTIKANEQIRFNGRSMVDNDRSGIWASVKADSTGGEGGDVFLESKEVFLDDAVISTETAGPGSGGNISVKSGTLEMTNKAEINSSSTTQFNKGNAGTIAINAGAIWLKQDSVITTSSQGQGQAGAITLDAGTLEIETGSRIVSESKSGNAHTVTDIFQRDARFVLLGDVAEETGTYDGKPRNYVWVGEKWIRYNRQHVVGNDAELNALAQNHSLESGDIAIMRDSGGGAPAQFVYDSENSAWLRSEHQYRATDNPNKIILDSGFAMAGYGFEEEWLGLPEGTLLELGDMLTITGTDQGKAENYYVYKQLLSGDYHVYYFRRLSLSAAEHVADLSRLSDTYALSSGDVAYVADDGNGENAEFVHDGETWIRFGSVHSVASRDDLVIAKTGDVVNVNDGVNGARPFIFSGEEWLLINTVHHLADIPERDRLSAQTGDLAKVADIGNGDSGCFLFSNGDWVSTYKSGDAGTISITAKDAAMLKGGDAAITTSTAGQGNAGNILLNAGNLDLEDGANIASASLSEFNGGDAGTVTVHADDSVRVSENASLTTEAKGAGGGKISMHAENTLYLLNGQMTSSVKQGQGNGGDITTHSEFVVLNHGKITANAEEGDGGAIFVHTDNYVKSANSRVTATSARGNDGTVKIEAPDLDISSGLTVLPAAYLDAARWIRTPCAARTGEKQSRLVLKGRDAVPTPVDDVQPSPPLWVRHPDPNGLICKGREYYESGDFEHAVRTWEHAVSLLDVEKDAYMDILMYLASANQARGHHQNALDALSDALPLVEKRMSQDDSAAIALFFSTLGDIHLSLGDMDAAAFYLNKALDPGHLTPYPLVLARVSNNKGNLLAANKDHQGAMAAYREGLELVQGSSHAVSDVLKSKILVNMARVVLQDGDHQEGFAALNDALSYVRNLPDAYAKAEDMISLGLLLSRSYIPLAFQTLDEARQIGEKIGNARIMSYANGYLGQLYEAEGRHPDAANLTRQAIFHAQEGNFPEMLYLWQWQLGRVLNAQGDIEHAVSMYHDAVSTLNPIRQELFKGYRTRKNLFSESVRPVYLGLADLLLKQAETSGGLESSDMWQETRLRQARDTMELLKTAELQDFFEDECVTAMQKKTTRLDRAPSRTAIIYPIPLQDSLVLLLTLPDCMKQVRVPVRSEHLSSVVKRFRRLLQTRSSYRFRKDARQLYDWLIRPAETMLASREIDTLIIAPDSVLRLIPFAPLYDGDHFLIEKYAIVTVPAVTLIDPRKIGSEDIQMLIAGLSEAREGFPPLPNVSREMRNIQEVMGGRILQDQDYTLNTLTDEFKSQAYTIVHLATHGQFGGTPQNTFVLTADGKLTMDRLEQLIRFGRFRDKQVELLTLSACQTAVGDERAALGLAGIAIKAGVRSAIATLWFVDDEATSVAISEFYRQLRIPGTSKAKALQNVQKDMISRIRYQHPVYWAPFLMIGNWL